MTDLLVRNVDPALKRALTERAHASGRSLSDEVKVVLQDAIHGSGDRGGFGTSLRALVTEFGGVDLEIPPRDDYGREPPSFD